MGSIIPGGDCKLTINLQGTYDPEGDDLWCWAEASFEAVGPDPEDPSCPEQIITSFVGATDDDFTVTVFASDGTNPHVSWTFSVELYNELPNPQMVTIRNGNTSADWIRLDGTGSLDPEGDEIRFELHSDLDGLLTEGTSSTGSVEWIGTLSKGNHTITLKVSDTRAEHAGQWNQVSESVTVSNSPPSAIISAPTLELMSTLPNW